MVIDWVAILVFVLVVRYFWRAGESVRRRRH